MLPAAVVGLALLSGSSRAIGTGRTLPRLERPPRCGAMSTPQRSFASIRSGVPRDRAPIRASTICRSSPEAGAAVSARARRHARLVDPAECLGASTGSLRPHRTQNKEGWACKRPGPWMPSVAPFAAGRDRRAAPPRHGYCVAGFRNRMAVGGGWRGHFPAAPTRPRDAYALSRRVRHGARWDLAPSPSFVGFDPRPDGERRWRHRGWGGCCNRNA